MKAGEGEKREVEVQAANFILSFVSDMLTRREMKGWEGERGGEVLAVNFISFYLSG